MYGKLSSLLLLFGVGLVGKLHLTVAGFGEISLIAVFFIKSKRFSEKMMAKQYSYFNANVVKFRGE